MQSRLEVHWRKQYELERRENLVAGWLMAAIVVVAVAAISVAVLAFSVMPPAWR